MIQSNVDKIEAVLLNAVDGLVTEQIRRASRLTREEAKYALELLGNRGKVFRRAINRQKFIYFHASKAPDDAEAFRKAPAKTAAAVEREMEAAFDFTGLLAALSPDASRASIRLSQIESSRVVKPK